MITTGTATVQLVADGLTKPLQVDAFRRFLQFMNVGSEVQKNDVTEVNRGGLQKIVAGLAVTRRFGSARHPTQGVSECSGLSDCKARHR